MKRKSILSLILTLAMVLALASCGAKTPDPKPAPDASAESSASAEASVSAEASFVEEGSDLSDDTEDPIIYAYFEIVDTYELALKEGWNQEQMLEAGLSYMAKDAMEYGSVGWNIADLNGDGVDELVIGCSSKDVPYLDNMIFQMYGKNGDRPELLLESGERSVWKWHDTGVLMNSGSASAAQSWWKLCSMDGELTTIDAVQYDEENESGEPWSRVDGEDQTPLTEDEALKLVEEMETAVTDMDINAFSAEAPVEADENGYAVKNGVITAYVGEDIETTTPADADCIANSAFSSDMGHGENLQKVRITGNIKTIEGGAFAFTAAKEIYLEEGVETIEYNAFMDSYIKDIWIPASVTELGANIMETEEGLRECTIHVVKDSAAAKYFEENPPYGEVNLAYDYQ